MKLKVVSITLLFTLIISSIAFASSFTGKCINIDDGNIIVVMKGNDAVRVRLAGIACPEAGQSFHDEAAQFISNLILGKDIFVDVKTVDYDKRLVSSVKIDGKELSQELIKGGLAWYYDKISKNTELASAEQAARKQKLGIWSQPNPEAPWDYKRTMTGIVPIGMTADEKGSAKSSSASKSSDYGFAPSGSSDTASASDGNDTSSGNPYGTSGASPGGSSSSGLMFVFTPKDSSQSNQKQTASYNTTKNAGSRDSDNGRTKPNTQQAATATGSAKEWCLAAGAIINQVNCDRHDLLGGRPLNSTQKQRSQEVLRQYWDIKNGKDAFTTLEWLRTQGHSGEYKEIAGLIKISDPSLLTDQVLISKGIDQDTISQLRFVQKHSRNLEGRNLTAWDMCRLINVAGWCYNAGYITEQEAWGRIRPAAMILQRTYSSWQDMGRNYLLGRQFWQPELYQSEASLFEGVVRKLCSDPSSPWVRIPWQTNLNQSE
ncbi:MAG: DUF1266 domain-containing protein [Candidatus Xenobiia bacterium LiM19]